MSEDAQSGRRWFVMSAIGEDRPGIVADLAELIYESECNLEDSRMTILGTEFATLLLASGTGADVEARLAAGCKRLEWEKHLTVFLRAVDGPARVPPHGTRLVCTVTGVDKAGIVARIARSLATHGANVTDLRSEVRPAPNIGTPIYALRIVAHVPPGTDLEAVRSELDRRATELAVDLVLEHTPEK